LGGREPDGAFTRCRLDVKNNTRVKWLDIKNIKQGFGPAYFFVLTTGPVPVCGLPARYPRGDWFRAVRAPIIGV